MTILTFLPVCGQTVNAMETDITCDLSIQNPTYNEATQSIETSVNINNPNSFAVHGMLILAVYDAKSILSSVAIDNIDLVYKYWRS